MSLMHSSAILKILSFSLSLSLSLSLSFNVKVVFPFFMNKTFYVNSHSKSYDEENPTSKCLFTTKFMDCFSTLV